MVTTSLSMEGSEMIENTFFSGLIHEHRMLVLFSDDFSFIVFGSTIPIAIKVMFTGI